jgi:hypothetical protein
VGSAGLTKRVGGKVHLKRLAIAVSIASYYVVNLIIGIVAASTHSALLGLIAAIMIIGGTLGVALGFILVMLGWLLYQVIWVEWIKK